MEPQKLLRLLAIIVSWFPNLRAIDTVSAVEQILDLEQWPLDCSAYAWNSSSKNKTLQKMNFAARLHACFDANPYDISQLPVFPLNVAPMESVHQNKQQLTRFEIDYHFGVIYVIAFAHGEISLLGGTSLSWTDEYRAWNKSQIPIDYVQVRLDELWYPQLLFVSTTQRRSLKLFEPDDMAQIYSDGYVSLIRRNVLEGHCDVNYLKFPFDRQKCRIQFSLELFFEPAYKSEFDVVLVRRIESETGLFEWFENDEWHLGKVSHETRNYSYQKILHKSQKQELRYYGNETYMTGFEVNITLRRQPQFYVVNIIIPILVLSVMGQTAFAVPEHADAKIVVPLTVLLGFMFVQGIVANELPRSAEYPLLAVFILACEVLTCLNCCLCSICMWLSLNGLRVPSRVARSIQRVSNLFLLRHTHLKILHQKTIRSIKHRPEDALDDLKSSPINDSHKNRIPKLPIGTASANHSQLQMRGHIGFAPVEFTGETLLLCEQNAVEIGEMLAKLLNRVLSIVHLVAIILLFMALILFPLILIK